MKKNYLFLAQTLMVLSLLFAIGCSNNDDERDDDDDTETPNVELYVGQSYQGGRIFYINDTGKHGLIAAPSDEMGHYSWDEAISVCEKRS